MAIEDSDGFGIVVRAIEIKNDYGLAYNNLASLLQQLQRTEEALSMFEKARSFQKTIRFKKQFVSKKAPFV